MNLHTSFEYLLQELAVVMTQPSFQNFVTIVTGWIFARRRTLTASVAIISHYATPVPPGGSRL